MEQGQFSQAILLTGLNDETVPVLVSKVQWAAVSTWRLVMMEPPHQGVTSPGDTRPTCHGYSFTSVSWPPTILVCLLTTPQLHVTLGFRFGVVFVPGTSVCPACAVVVADVLDVTGGAMIRTMSSIKQYLRSTKLTRLRCGNINRATRYRQESAAGDLLLRMKLNCDGCAKACKWSGKGISAKLLAEVFVRDLYVV